MCSSDLLRTGMQDVMEASAGIFRSQDTLSQGADQLRELQDRATSMAVDDHSREFNTQVVAALELANMLDIAECILFEKDGRKHQAGAAVLTADGRTTAVARVLLIAAAG